MAISLTAHCAIIDLIVSLHRSLTRREPSNKPSNKTGPDEHQLPRSSHHAPARRITARCRHYAQRTSPIPIDENVVKEIQAVSDRSTRYGILPKTLDVSKALDRSFTAAAAGSN